MDLNKQLKRSGVELPPREEKIRETIAGCREIWFRQEQNRLLTYWEFLWTQLQYTRKRWWALQLALLLLACRMVPALEDHYTQLRSMGVISCLFVVLMIPELWRNRESDSIQVEAACLYSLRQVYAARITLFGMVDIVLLTVFSVALGRMGFTLTEVLSQFLLPVTVMACICFSLLCRRSACSETVSLGACLGFGGIWWLVLRNEQIYRRILPSMWAALLAMALVFLALAVRRTVRTANQSWEVEFV